MTNAINGLTSTAQAETPLNSNLTTRITGNETAPAAKAKAPLNSNADFTTFLKMLTAQMQNQDPLNPVEANDFAVQLATFSSVEQQTRTNQLLTSLVERGEGLNEAAGWIGKEASTKEPVWFGSEPIELDIKPKPNADRVVLSAINEQGIVSYSEDIPPDGGEGQWFGRDIAGRKLPDGKYTFKINSFKDGVNIGESDVSAYTRIEGARRGEKGIELIFTGDAFASVAEVEALRQVR